MYDCTKSIMEHKRHVECWMQDVADQLSSRAKVHDNSKLDKSEKAVFDEFRPVLERVEFGSSEYNQSLEAMGPGLAHHYRHNSHHPEHFPNGIDGMTLIDLVEMFCDWLAAAENKGTHMDLNYLQQRFGLSDQLVSIFHNTLKDMASQFTVSI